MYLRMHHPLRQVRPLDYFKRGFLNYSRFHVFGHFYHRVVCLYISLMLLSGCSLIPSTLVTLEGSKSIKKIEKVLSPFQSISVSIPAHVEISPNQENLCEISGDDNLLPFIEFEQHGDSLNIYAKNGYQLAPSRPIQIKLSAVSIQRIDLSGNGVITASRLIGEEIITSLRGDGKIVLNDIHYKKIKTTLDGRGNISLSGEVETQIIYLSGGGTYSGESLLSERGTASIGGIGDINLYVRTDLVVFIGGSGNVRYWGKPEVSQKITGPGKLYAMGPAFIGDGKLEKPDP